MTGGLLHCISCFLASIPAPNAAKCDWICSRCRRSQLQFSMAIMACSAAIKPVHSLSSCTKKKGNPLIPCPDIAYISQNSSKLSRILSLPTPTSRYASFVIAVAEDQGLASNLLLGCWPLFWLLIRQVLHVQHHALARAHLLSHTSQQNVASGQRGASAALGAGLPASSCQDKWHCLGLALLNRLPLHASRSFLTAAAGQGSNAHCVVRSMHVTQAVPRHFLGGAAVLGREASAQLMPTIDHMQLTTLEPQHAEHQVLAGHWPTRCTAETCQGCEIRLAQPHASLQASTGSIAGHGTGSIA